MWLHSNEYDTCIIRLTRNAFHERTHSASSSGGTAGVSALVPANFIVGGKGFFIARVSKGINPHKKGDGNHD